MVLGQLLELADGRGFEAVVEPTISSVVEFGVVIFGASRASTLLGKLDVPHCYLFWVAQPKPIFLDLLSDPVENVICQASVCGLNMGSQPQLSSIFSASMNASCGISTDPNSRIFFLPFFCFSSSLRLREMSPP